MGRIFSQFTEEKWNQVRNHPYFASSVKKICQKAEKYIETEPPRIKFSEIHLYAVTGDRVTFQNVYSNYQDRLETFFFTYLVTKDEKYISYLSDVLWNILDFETWTIPAHVREQDALERRHTWLDLCSSIMGYRISEILYFIGDKLPELVYRRAKNEIRVRIIESYRDHNDFWWHKADNNWSAVCMGAVFASYVYIAEKEEIDAQIPRMLETMNCYLSGFDDEGCCKEGYGYWNYGFSHFCLFASLLREYTNGEIDLFKNEKVYAIAKFQQNVTINETEIISFSDCGRIFSPTPWLSHFLKKEYPDIEIPGFEESKEISAPLRYTLWQEPEFAKSKMNPKSVIFHNTQWFIYRSPAYNFAIKAGYNAEPHNHNDIGSFLISKGGKVSFTDPGGGIYTRQYFDPKERYNFLIASSRGHSVPVINGEYQTVGKNKSTVYAESENEYSFSMENGYEIKSLKSLRRDVKCLTDHAVITDTYLFDETPESVVERFVSFIEPKITDAGIICGETLLSFDENLLDASIGSEVVENSKNKDILYFVDLKVKSPSNNFSVTVELK